MKNIPRTLTALAALALTITGVRLLGAQQPTPGQTQPVVVKGELLSVDAVAKTLTIRTPAKEEMQFRYDDHTEVTGAKEGSAGLATMKGAEVTVHFKREGHDNLAIKLEVRSVLKLAQMRSHLIPFSE